MTAAAFEILVGMSAAPGLGPKTIRALLEVWGTAEALVDAARRGDLERRPVRRGVAMTAASRATLCEDVAGAPERGRRVLDACDALGARAISRADPFWPASIECLGDVPEILFVRGRLELFRERAVGIVGSRECSPEGYEFAARLASRLAQEGWATVSGLARGIDGAAHRGSLDAGGDTLAVLGCGIDETYPEENRALQQRIASEGLLVSEFAPGMPPVAGNFPRRNRILAALAHAVVVVECRLRSGALVTCRHAFEHGKEVFVVPGWPDAPLSAGPLQLLRDGARSIRGADDLLEDLGGIGGGPFAPALEEDDAGDADERERAARRELLGVARP